MQTLVVLTFLLAPAAVIYLAHHQSWARSIGVVVLCYLIGMTIGSAGLMPERAQSAAQWLSDAAIAVEWARGQETVEPSRFGFFGTSQGGGTALLLGSIFSGVGTKAVAADEPYLTNYPLAHGLEVRGAYQTTFGPMANA